MSNPARGFPRPLSDLLGATLTDVMKAQGFASGEILARWSTIVGPEIAAFCEPLKINWPRPSPKAETGDAPPEPATLVLRVEGPMALEIQHMSGAILERVNRFFGWQAVGRLALRQAPLRRRSRRPVPKAPDPALVERIASTLPVEDENLRNALARLGAAIKRK